MNQDRRAWNSTKDKHRCHRLGRLHAYHSTRPHLRMQKLHPQRYDMTVVIPPLHHTRFRSLARASPARARIIIISRNLNLGHPLEQKYPWATRPQIVTDSSFFSTAIPKTWNQTDSRKISSVYLSLYMRLTLSSKHKIHVRGRVADSHNSSSNVVEARKVGILAAELGRSVPSWTWQR